MPVTPGTTCPKKTWNLAHSAPRLRHSNLYVCCLWQLPPLPPGFVLKPAGVRRQGNPWHTKADTTPENRKHSRSRLACAPRQCSVFQRVSAQSHQLLAESAQDIVKVEMPVTPGASGPRSSKGKGCRYGILACSNYLSLEIQIKTPSLKSKKLAGSSHALIRRCADCMSWHLVRGWGLALVTTGSHIENSDSVKFLFET